MSTDPRGGPAADGTGALPALERVCPDCQGTGKIAPVRQGNHYQGGGSCNTCRYTGTVPTEDGLKLLNFLHRHRR
ncbi:MAG TPA: hypothetical protein VF628_11175 [Allosphingosinicella sp.]|jgi:DnaJ-class molecular chaperone